METCADTMRRHLKEAQEHLLLAQIFMPDDAGVNAEQLAHGALSNVDELLATVRPTDEEWI